MNETEMSEMDEREDTVVNIDNKWANAVREKLGVEAKKQMSHEDFTICKIPARIQQGKEMNYNPSFVSIGPYHRGEKQLQSMESYKWKRLQDFLGRNPRNSLEIYIQNLRELEDRARSCYFDHIDLTSEKFVEMLLLDSCFIIEHILNKYTLNSYGYSIWLCDQIVEDLILLENQIPFFIIQRMFELVTNKPENSPDFINKAIPVLLEISNPSPIQPDDLPSMDPNHIDHLLHLCYNCIVRPEEELNRSDRKPFFALTKRLLVKWLNPLHHISMLLSCWRRVRYGSSIGMRTKATNIQCASKLVEAGIKFKKRKGKTLLDITFNDGVLAIPPIMIADNTKPCMFNMVALEQHKNEDMQMSTYAQFMDFIVDTPKDVEILEECGILESYFKTKEETALFFNQLNDFVFICNKDGNIDRLCKAIINFCESDWHRHRSKLVRDYFSNPWAIISLIAALVLLALTFLQTFFTIYPYFHQKNSQS